jgi:hypothetical protein
MNGTNGAADCLAYIDKLAYFGSNYSPGQIIISASAGGYANTNWYFDGAPGYEELGTYAEQGVTNVDPTASITGSSEPISVNYIKQATNVAGYYNPGWWCDSNPYMFDSTNNYVSFFGHSGWFIMATVDSYSGVRDTFQAGFLSWFTTNSFAGTNYSNTPVGGVTYVDEPTVGGEVDKAAYFGDWAAGKSFAICAWATQVMKLQVVGDPFVKK